MLANFEYYKVFYYCARYHNITVAANKLCVSQPSVTKTIQNLETALGCQLFFRSKKGVSLTPKGQMLYDKICPACELIFSAEQDLDAAKSQQEGIIRMGASETTCRVWLLPRLLRFRSMYPKIKIKIEYLPQLSMAEKLSSMELDFAIVNTPLNLAEDQSAIDVADFEDMFVCGRNFRELSEREVSAQELADYPLVLMPEGSSTRQYIDAHFAKFGVKLKPDIEFSTLSLVAYAVEQNLGIGTVPFEYAQEGMDRGSLFRVRLKEKMPYRKISIVTSKSHPLGIAANMFLEEFAGEDGAPS